MKFAPFEYAAPATVREAIALLASRPGEAKLLAGGQSLLPTMAFRLAQPALLVDLGRVAELRGIEVAADGATHLGALTRWCDVQDHEDLSRAQPLLARAIGHVAHYQVRNRGTVGGSLAHADPAAEMPCVAVTCEAQIVIAGPSGDRVMPAADFFLGPLTTDLAEDEIIVRVDLPAWPATRRWSFLEFSRRPGDFALAGVALFYDVDHAGFARNVHVGVIGSRMRPERLAGAESVMEGAVLPEDSEERNALAVRVAKRAFEEYSAADDYHASGAYRRSLLATLVSRAVASTLTGEPVEARVTH